MGAGWNECNTEMSAGSRLWLAAMHKSTQLPMHNRYTGALSLLDSCLLGQQLLIATGRIHPKAARQRMAAAAAVAGGCDACKPQIAMAQLAASIMLRWNDARHGRCCHTT